MSTIETAFTGWVPPVNLDQGSTIPFCFVFQLGHKLRPSDIADRFGRLLILDHVFDCQRLNTDRLVFTDQACREFVQEITASISDTGMDTCYFLAGFVSVLRAFFLFRVSSLSFCQFLLIFGEEFGIAHNFTSRRGRQRISTQDQHQRSVQMAGRCSMSSSTRMEMK